jgi:hypothetical protein
VFSDLQASRVASSYPTVWIVFTAYVIIKTTYTIVNFATTEQCIAISGLSFLLETPFSVEVPTGLNAIAYESSAEDSFITTGLGGYPTCEITVGGGGTGTVVTPETAILVILFHDH